jgi:hypothetical protein
LTILPTLGHLASSLRRGPWQGWELVIWRAGSIEASIDTVWDAIALHTTPGIPQHKQPEVALVTAGVEMRDL